MKVLEGWYLGSSKEATAGRYTPSMQNLPVAAVQLLYNILYTTSPSESIVVWRGTVYDDNDNRIYETSSQTREEGMHLIDEWLVANGWILLDRKPKLRSLI